ncbi:MAG TPA: hypothetical protein VNY52_11620 [Solirubrobacteraceae bacterium]|jgi:hypothetical protein|nr:hypothetical protein [Solirubrobacteraceae bacterium]
MFSRIRGRFTYANVALTLALVFAMSGGAYAAKRYLITSTKQISPKVLKALSGAPGPAGPEGRAGAPGLAGKDGANGKDGAAGTPGESVSVKSVPTKVAACSQQGGAEFRIGSGTPAFACNGNPAETPKALPLGQTETGAWGYSGALPTTAISFPIPLAAPLTGLQVHYVTRKEVVEKKAPAACPGSANEPQAVEGNLCVYGQFEAGFSGSPYMFVPGKGPSLAEGGEEGAGTQGVGLLQLVEGTAVGTWAVTAE